MELKILFTKKAFKNYKKIPRRYKLLIDRELEKLEKNEKADIKPVKGQKNIYRLRVGNYRVLYEIINPDLIIVNIDVRGNIYKN
jgi:mRNA interferase RelE/StbE